MQCRQLIGPMWRGDELRFRCAADVLLKDAVGVVEVGNDYCELGKVSLERLVELAMASEEAGERSRFDGTHRVREAAKDRKLRDVRITEDFDACFGKVSAQCCERWKRQNEIPNRPAANDQDFILH